MLRSVPTSKILIALGANLDSPAGTPAQTLAHALKRLSDSQLTVEAVSPFYATPCYPPRAGPDYVNAAARLSGSDDPDSILAVLHRIEAEFGRERDQRWGRRTLDLDLLAVGNLVLPDAATYRKWRDIPLDRQRTEAPERLILPHPRMHERAFVLVPLAAVACGWRHPVLGQTVGEMVDALPQQSVAEVHALGDWSLEPPS